MGKNKIYIFGVDLTDLSIEGLLTKIEENIQNNKFTQIVTANPEIMVKVYNNITYKNIVRSSEIVLTDGFGLQLVVWLKYLRYIPRITGVELIQRLVAKENKIYLLGGRGNTAKLASERYKNRYPKSRIVGFDSGGEINSNNIKDKLDLIDKINHSGAEILVVALGAPIQEEFIKHWKDQLSVSVAIGAGGTLDYVAGVVPIPPKFIKSIGLEWLWRLITQPKRIKRIATAVFIFPWLVLTKDRKVIQ